MKFDPPLLHPNSMFSPPLPVHPNYIQVVLFQTRKGRRGEEMRGRTNSSLPKWKRLYLNPSSTRRRSIKLRISFWTLVTRPRG